MIYKRNFFGFFFIVILIGCNQEKGSSEKSLEKLIGVDELKLDTLIKLELDHETMAYSPSLQFYTDDSTEIKYLTFLNVLNNCIYWYNYDEGKLSKRTKLERNGPNGVGKAQAHYILNKDSIFTINEQSFDLFLVDENGKLLNKYDLSEANSPRANTQSPMIKIGSELIIANYFNSASHKPITESNESLDIIINLESGETRFTSSYPPSYIGKTWSEKFLQVHKTFNYSTSEIIYDFPASHYLHISNFKTRENISVKAKFEFFENIDPISDQEIEPLEMRETVKDFFLKDSYYATYFDQYRQMFVRVGLKAIGEENYLNGEREKKIFYMTLDSDFNVLRVFTLPNEKYTASMIFFTKEGLNIVKVDNENEDELQIGRFTHY